MTVVLITGFGRFPGAPFNPTAMLARHLAARRRPALADVNRIAHVFRTSYASVSDELPQLVKRHRPDAVLLFGLAGRTPHVRVETRAQNRFTLVFPDADGFVPPQGAIRPGQGALAGRAPFRRLAAAGQAARVRTRLSRDAGRYVCNFAYWRALEETRAAAPLVVFVHVPMTRSSSRRNSKLQPALADLVRVGEAILVALVAAARARR